MLNLVHQPAAMDVLGNMVICEVISIIKHIFDFVIFFIGFVTYSDVCWFDRNNYLATKVYDAETCSPYMYAIDEWISYEDERSISCKTNYVKEMGYGGVMIFSLNTDDYSSYCDYGKVNSNIDPSRFPLTRLINSILL